jgi:hypothetical protein
MMEKTGRRMNNMFRPFAKRSGQGEAGAVISPLLPRSSWMTIVMLPRRRLPHSSRTGRAANDRRGDEQQGNGQPLSIAPEMVEHYRAQTMQKRDMHGSATLTRYAVRVGLVTVEG